MAATVGIGAVVGGLSNFAGGLIGSNAASSAASAETSALNKAYDFQTGVYDTTQTNLNPYISGGKSALSGLEAFLGLGDTTGTGQGGNALSSYKAFQQTPYYTFPLQQGTQTMEQSAAAKGLDLTGGQLAGLNKYGQNYASSNFSQYISALSGLANLGQSSSVNLGQQGNTAASNVSNIQSGVASAEGSGIIGSANALRQGLSGLSTALGGGGTGSSYGNSGSSGSSSGGLISMVGNALSGLFGGGSNTLNLGNVDTSGSINAASALPGVSSL